MGTNSTQNEVKNGFSLSKYLGNRGGCESCHPDQNPLIWAFFIFFFGMWRSLVAHTPGGRGVAGSNPVIPTKPSDLSGGFLL